MLWDYVESECKWRIAGQEGQKSGRLLNRIRTSRIQHHTCQVHGHPRNAWICNNWLYSRMMACVGCPKLKKGKWLFSITADNCLCFSIQVYWQRIHLRISSYQISLFNLKCKGRKRWRETLRQKISNFWFSPQMLEPGSGLEMELNSVHISCVSGRNSFSWVIQLLTFQGPHQ